MTHRDLFRKLRLFVLVFATGSLVVLSPATSSAQTSAKKVVKTQDDLPRFNYPITGTATELVKSDDATFNAFASKVQADVDSVLSGHEYPGTTRPSEACSASSSPSRSSPAPQDKAALVNIAKLRDLEDKPDAKLLSGIRTEAFL